MLRGYRFIIINLPRSWVATTPLGYLRLERNIAVRTWMDMERRYVCNEGGQWIRMGRLLIHPSTWLYMAAGVFWAGISILWEWLKLLLWEFSGLGRAGEAPVVKKLADRFEKKLWLLLRQGSYLLWLGLERGRWARGRYRAMLICRFSGWAIADPSVEPVLYGWSSDRR